jgi:CheY-like chemotaxis protein
MKNEDAIDSAALFAGLKVLVVDDSKAMRDLLLALLNSMGIGEVVCADDGRAGLRLYAETSPDLVITDGMMEPMTGYAMTSAIRGLKSKDGLLAGSDVPVLMLSGHGEPDIVEWARDEGVTDYIVKPVTAELLYERIIAAVAKPLHIVETATYRGPSPRRRLVAHEADIPSVKP